MDIEIGADSALEDALKAIISTDLYVDVPVDEMSVEDDLQEVFGLDSLGFVELRAQCERRFGVVIGDADFNPVRFHSIASVARLVRELRAAQGESAS